MITRRKENINHQENSTKNTKLKDGSTLLLPWERNYKEGKHLTHLQKTLGRKKDFILLVNIRSLNVNHVKLQLFIKPAVIICTETRVLQGFEFFSLHGYKIYYNYSEINITDGVVIYMKENTTENTEVIQVGKLNIINTC